MKSNHHIQGFTLIELLVVVGIISILSNIAIVRFHEFREIVIDKEHLFVTNKVKDVFLGLGDSEVAIGTHQVESSPYSYSMRYDNTRGPSDIRVTYHNTAAFFEDMSPRADVEIYGYSFLNIATGLPEISVSSKRCTTGKTYVFVRDTSGEYIYTVYDAPGARCGS